MLGKIIKGIAGFYYVNVIEAGIYECKAKGIFRKQNIKPLVGDDVIVEIISHDDKTGNIADILPRKNQLVRPAVANVDQALVIFATGKPSPNFNLLDRFLISMEQQRIHTIICFNKKDIASAKKLDKLKNIYAGSGYSLLFTSAQQEEGLKELLGVLKDRTTVVAGPSGVGKSSIINRLQSDVKMQVGAISQKIDRGKHTTRHSELILIEGRTYIVDTPGFSSMYTADFEKEELKEYFKEFEQYRDECKFQGCDHLHEPDCTVKRAVEEGKINATRYQNYKLLYEELKNQRRY